MRLGLVLLLFYSIASAEWWSFRGPGGNGTSSLTKLPTTWSATRNIAWKTAVPGRGHSSPVIVAGKVCVTTSIEGDSIPGHKAAAQTMGGQPFVHPQTTAEDKHVTLKGLCFDQQTGKLLWERTVFAGGTYDSRHTFNTHASPTPLTDGRRVFFYFESQGLHAFDLNGKPLWKLSIGGLRKMNLGAGTSPVMAGGLIVLQADEGEVPTSKSMLYGVSPETGEIVWKTRRDASVAWNTPVVVRHGGSDIVIVAATEHVIAYDPTTGKELWRGQAMEGFASASAVSGHGLVFPNTFHPVKKVLALRVDPEAKERLAWKFDKGTAYIPSPIVYGDYLYLMAGNGALTALEARTGKLVYEGKRIPKSARFTASPVAFDGKLLLTSEDGDTYVIKAGPEHEVLATNSLEEQVFASLALDGNSIYIRAVNHLYRILEN